jgi:hypothetical protein
VKRFSYLMLFFALPLIAEWQSSCPHEEALEFQKPQDGWVRIYGFGGEEWPFCIHETIDGGYIVAGHKILKLDSEGDTVWVKDYGGDYARIGSYHSVEKTKDGGYILTGQFKIDDGACRYYVGLQKIDGNGDSLWAYVYGDPFLGNCGESVVETEDGGFVFTGDMYNDEEGDLFFWRVDSLGNTIWTRHYGSHNSKGNCVQNTLDGEFVLTGNISPKSWYYDLWLIKTDAQGNIKWQKQFDGGRVDYGHCVHETDDGGLVISGSFDWYEEVNALWLIKTDLAGNKQWDKLYYNNAAGFVTTVDQTSDGGYAVFGSTKTDQPYGDAWLIKTDSSGKMEWSQTYGSEIIDTYASTDYCYYGEQTSDGGYILAIRSYDTPEPNNTNKYLIIKTDSLGHVPLEVSPTKVESPIEGYALNNINPKALFTNFGTPVSAPQFYYHCKITDLNDSTYFYHDSVPGSLESWESKWVEFKEWTAPAISDFECTFYTTGAGKCQPMTVSFRWTGIKEQPPSTHPTFKVVTAVGNFVLLSSQSEERSQLSVFDASGRLVDEVVLDGPGTVSWPVTPDGFSPGVYFFRDAQGSQTQKAVLVR